MGEDAYTLRGTLRQCPRCVAALILTDGQMDGITVWGPPSAPYLTPHHPDCNLRGKALPDDHFDTVLLGMERTDG